MVEPVYLALAWEVVVAIGVGFLGGALATYRMLGPAAAVALKRSAADDPAIVDAPHNANFDYKMVFLIRQDLKMEKGKVAAQVRITHCVNVYCETNESSAATRRWMPTSAP